MSSIITLASVNQNQINAFVELASKIRRELYYKDLSYNEFFSHEHLERACIKPYEIISQSRNEDYCDFYLITRNGSDYHDEDGFERILFQENNYYTLYRYIKSNLSENHKLKSVELSGCLTNLKNLFTYPKHIVEGAIYGFTNINLSEPYDLNEERRDYDFSEFEFEEEKGDYYFD